MPLLSKGLFVTLRSRRGGTCINNIERKKGVREVQSDSKMAWLS